MKKWAIIWAICSAAGLIVAMAEHLRSLELRVNDLEREVFNLENLKGSK